MKLLFLLALTSLAGAQVTSFPPLQQWKSAVLAGDQASLSKLYQTNPPPHLLVNQSESTLASELDFWTALKSSGLTALNPKVLSMSTENGNSRQLVLRIQGTEARNNIVISAVQLWVRQPGGWRIAASKRSDVYPDQGRSLPEPAKPNPELYPPPGEAQPELKAALARAAAEHKRVLVVFGANWCYDCHVLDATFRSAAFAPLVSSSYVVLHVNIGDEGKDNNDLAARLGVSLEHGVPSLAILNPDGSVVVAQKNGEFESTTRIGPTDVRSFLEKWKPSGSIVHFTPSGQEWRPMKARRQIPPVRPGCRSAAGLP